MGCLFAIFAGLFPRLALFIVWVAKPALVSAAFTTWLVPLLGIIFLPFATLMYVILFIPGFRSDRVGVVLGHPRRSIRSSPPRRRHCPPSRTNGTRVTPDTALSASGPARRVRAAKED